LADQGLRQHQVGEVGFTDLGEQLVVVHWVFLSFGVQSKVIGLSGRCGLALLSI
jgi:hypothetical protein